MKKVIKEVVLFNDDKIILIIIKENKRKVLSKHFFIITVENLVKKNDLVVFYNKLDDLDLEIEKVPIIYV